MRVLVGWAMLLAALPVAPAQEKGFQPERRVKAPARLDWEFAAGPRATVSASYDSRKQRYQLFVPRTYSTTRSWPLVVFVSPGDDPLGWRSFQVPCDEAAVLFAAPYGAGNACPSAQRLRIVLDVLDDVRAHYRVDPEQTYLAGLGGGAEIASQLATAFPEYVGGILAIGGDVALPRLPYLRHRLRDRLSVALVATRSDSGRLRQEKYLAPLLRDLGIRSRFWLAEDALHGLPPAKIVAEMLRWLGEDVKHRQADARALGLQAAETPTRRQLATQALARAEKELRDPNKIYLAASLLEWIVARCGKAPDADRAAERLRELREDDVQGRLLLKQSEAEVRQRLTARARALESFGDLDAARRAWDGVALLAQGDEQKKARAEERRVAALLAKSPYLGLTLAGNTLTIKEIVAGGPAELAGLQPGDEIESLNKVKVTTPAMVREEVRQLRPGDTLTIGLRRNAKPMTVPVRVGVLPKER